MRVLPDNEERESGCQHACVMSSLSPWCSACSNSSVALCGLAGRGGCLCVCCGSSLTGDLPFVVWPAGVAACVCVVALP